MALATRLDYSGAPSASSPDGSSSFPIQIASTAGGLPVGATPLSNGSTGTTGVISATLAPTTGKTAYVTSVTWSFGGATAAGMTTATLNNIGGGAGGLSYIVSWPAIASGPASIFTLNFNPAMPASAVSTNIIATIAAGQGSGGLLEAISIFGYQL
jgi:hypothetical protein